MKELTEYEILKNRLIIFSNARKRVLMILDNVKWYHFIINRKGINKINEALEKYHQMYMVELIKLDKYL